jgi:aminoglycoside phosphotransferase family enzyme/predicted kinase
VNRETIEQLMARAGDAPVLRETHISWVILCGDTAYKIRKPVNFGFLDFSTLEQRRHDCEQELVLNSRFAPEIYLAVEAVTADPGGPRFGGSGPVMDYAVKMRRFDEDQLLSNIAARGELSRSLLRALGCELARQQAAARSCYPAADSDLPGSPLALLAAIGQNFRQARAYPLAGAELEVLEAVENWTRRRHRELLPEMKRRVGAGMVLDGHGDAHLGNIALIDGRVRLFDCIEFNPAMRIMDGIAEIAFLCMDLQARGHAGEAHCLLGDYLEYRGDYAGLVLLDLYRSYFAMVRAKVALLREPEDAPRLAATPAYADFCRYLQLARDCCGERKRFVAITHGVSGSGKSTVADKLAAAGGAVRIRSDVERKRLFGLAPEQRSDRADEMRLYGSAMSRRTFDRLAELAGQILTAGYAVIVDATFLQRDHRQRFAALAAQRQVPFAIIDCVAPEAALRQRLQRRTAHGGDASEADVRVMEQQLAKRQPLAPQERAARLEAESTQDGAELWRRLQLALRAGGEVTD